MHKITGHCLCNKISFEFKTSEKHFDACHCSMCRHWNGGPALTVNAEKDLKLEGEEYLGIYSSSKWAERGFCKNCGSSLFYRLKQHDFCNFNLGVIDDHDQFTFTKQIYVDSKPDNYNFSEKTKMMTEAQVIASFKKST